MDFDGVVQIFFLSFSWQPNKEWKRTEKWFCLGLRMGVLEFIIFFNGVFMLNFLGLWIWFLGYEFYLLEVSLLIERWENLGLSWDFVYLGFVVWENLRRFAARFVFVFLLEIDLCLCLVDKKGQENLGMCSHVLNLGLCSLVFLLKMNLDLGNSYFFFC